MMIDCEFWFIGSSSVYESLGGSVFEFSALIVFNSDQCIIKYSKTSFSWDYFLTVPGIGIVVQQFISKSAGFAIIICDFFSSDIGSVSVGEERCDW